MCWLCIYFGRKFRLRNKLPSKILTWRWQIIAVLRNLWLALSRLPRLLYQIIVSIALHIVVLWYVSYKFICWVMVYILLQSCLCVKELIRNSVEECSENINRNELIYNETLNDYGKVCNSCAINIVLLVIYFLTSISIISAFIYFHWHLKKK